MSEDQHDEGPAPFERNRPPAPPSTPDEPDAAEADAAPAATGTPEPPEPPEETPAEDEGSPRVVGSGTDDEFVILDNSASIIEQIESQVEEGRSQAAQLKEMEDAPPEKPKQAAGPPDDEDEKRPSSHGDVTSPASPATDEREEHGVRPDNLLDADPEPRGPDRRTEGRRASDRRESNRRSTDRRTRIGSVLDRDWDQEFAEPERHPAGLRSRPASVAAVVPATHRVANGLAIGSALVFVAATVFMGLRMEPFATWYYVFAWYPFLFLVNHATAARSESHAILSRRLGRLVALAAWSVPVWMTFELWNLRLENWYYVGVPPDAAQRWTGVIASFATVLPGLFLLEEALQVHGIATRWSTPKFHVVSKLERGLRILGASWAALILAFPTFFFPLVWGVPVLLIEPWLHRRDDASLLHRVATGRPGLVVRLLLAGAACGLFWEAANFFALGKWIYTVPGLEKLKLFEMPLLGFVGFPPFALCCWSMARALVALGLLPDWRVQDAAKNAVMNAAKDEGTDEAESEAKDQETDDVEPDTEDDDDARPFARWPRRPLALGAATLLTVLTLAAMDRWTVDSTTPRLADIPGIPDGVAEYAARWDRDTVRGLLELIEEGKLYVPGTSSARVVSLLAARCHLVGLRGIGTENARRLDGAGIRTVDELAASDPEELVARLANVESGWSPRPRRVATWVAGAREIRPGVPSN